MCKSITGKGGHGWGVGFNLYHDVMNTDNPLSLYLSSDLGMASFVTVSLSTVHVYRT